MSTSSAFLRQKNQRIINTTTTTTTTTTTKNVRIILSCHHTVVGGSLQNLHRHLLMDWMSDKKDEILSPFWMSIGQSKIHMKLTVQTRPNCDGFIENTDLNIIHNYYKEKQNCFRKSVILTDRGSYKSSGKWQVFYWLWNLDMNQATKPSTESAIITDLVVLYPTMTDIITIRWLLTVTSQLENNRIAKLRIIIPTLKL